MEWSVLGSSGLAIAALMLSVWVLSVVLKDASIVDIIWGFGFVVVANVARLAADGGGAAHQLWLVVLTTVWGLRLTGYLFWRNHGKGEDYRYKAMRKHHGAKFPIISLVTVFGLQGVVMFIVSLPVQIGLMSNRPTNKAVLVLGIALWALGMFFETVGDYQLARFKADPASKGMVMNKGLWSWTRHPNYFGDFCVWWGLFVIALSGGGAPVWASIVGPMLMSYMLTRVSGAKMLERTIGRRRPGYDEYIRTTSGFFPRPPKK